MHREQLVEPRRPAVEYRVEQLAAPELDFYRTLYDAVGRDYDWVDRKMLDDAPFSLMVAEDMREAANKAVAAARGGSA